MRNLVKNTNSIRLVSLGVPALISVLLVASCVTVDPREGADFGNRGFEGSDIFLETALVASEYVPDRYSKIFLQTQVAEAYIHEQKPALASALLKRSEVAVGMLDSVSAMQQLRLVLADYYVTLGDTDKALELLKQSLDLALGIKDQASRGTALSQIVQFSFKIPEKALEVLKKAVDFVYVLDDPFMRVQILCDLGDRFQKVNRGNRSSALIQQAIAATASISNPWVKSEALTMIAARLFAEGNSAEGKHYANSSVDEVNSIEVLSLTESDVQHIYNIVANLISMGMVQESTMVASVLQDDQSRQTASIRVIAQYYKLNLALQARLATQRLLNLLETQGSGTLLMSSLSTLTDTILEYEGKEAAAPYADAMEYYLGQLDTSSRQAFLSRVVAEMAKFGRFQTCDALADEIVDPYAKARSVLSVLKSDMLSDAEFDHWFQKADDAVAHAGYLQDELRASIATVGLARTAGRLGMKDLLLIQDPFSLAQVLIDVARNQAGSWGSDVEKQVAALLKNIAVRKLPTKETVAK